MLNNFKKGLPYFLFIFFIILGCTASLTRHQNQALMEILDILSSTIAETEEILEKNTDPTSQYADILDKLTFMKEIIKEIQNGTEPYDEKKIAEYTVKIKEIEANIRNAVDKVFSSDIFFGLGKYKISDFSDEGKKSLNDLTQTIVDTQLKNFRKLFPGKTLIIVIKAIGYADETPLGQELSEILKKEMDTPVPSNPEDRKKLLNTRLSFLRAQSIFEYIKMQLNSMNEMEDIIIGQPDIQGFGEELPYPADSVAPPYQSQDERRRICKIYSKINIDSQ